VADNIDDIPKIEIDVESHRVVRAEHISATNEPYISFSKDKFWANTTCLRRLPNAKRIQVIIGEQTKRLYIKPATEYEKNTFLWCTRNSKKRSPKTVTCPGYFVKVIELMGWAKSSKFKIHGCNVLNGEELWLMFDLKDAKEYPVNSKTPIFPEEWQDTFGPTLAEDLVGRNKVQRTGDI